MATVYLADDLRHERQVALKVLKPELAATLGPERFLREIRIAAQLQHPHILPVHDSGEAEGSLFYVMPYVEGESLADRLAREGELPISDSVRILTDVADALTEAHERGVVHRDIKPANILLRGRHAQVTDFGVAKAISEATGTDQLTTVGVSLGTPAYMAPEQAAGDPSIDHRVDIYALGVVGYELLTGRRPFEGRTSQAILAAHVTESPRDVTEHRSSVPVVLGSAIMRCLEKKAADRFQSADELLAQLEAAVTPSGGTVPTQASADATRPVWRRRSAPAVIAIGVLALWAWGQLGGDAAPATDSMPEMQALTANPLETALTSSAISPDGSYLAFTEPNGLFVKTVATGEINRLELPEPLAPRGVGWFPDGTRLYVLAASDRYQLDLFTLPLLGGAPQPIYRSVIRARLSPDGTRFALITADLGDGVDRILTVGRQGEEPEVVIAAEPDEAYWDLAWSPDSRRIAYGLTTYVDGAAIRTVAPDGSEQTTLIEDRALFQSWTGVLPFHWCSEDRLFFSLRQGPYRNATSDVWVVGTDLERGTLAGEPRRLTQLTGMNIRQLSATADCASVVPLVVENQADVWTARVIEDGTLGEEAQVTFDQREDYPVSWLDENSLIFASASSGTFDFFRWSVDERESRDFARTARSTDVGAWAPTEGRFLYRSGGLWSTGPVGGTGEMISDGPIEAFDCTRGGCVAGQRIGPDFVFFQVDPATGAQSELSRIDYRPPFTNFALSPDGSTAAVVHLTDDKIRLVDVATGSEQEVDVDGWSRFEFVSWHADGEGLYINSGYATAGLYPVLLSVELDGTATVLRDRPNVFHVYPKTSPDGRYLAFSAMSFQGNAWLIPGF